MTGPTIEELLDEIERFDSWLARLPPDRAAWTSDEGFAHHCLSQGKAALRAIAEAQAFEQAKARHAYARSPS